MAADNQVTLLRTLAAEKGYLIARAPLRDCWFLVHEATGEIVSDSGRTALTLERAMAFLGAV